ncbi:MAG: Nif3-like dinuclear metal center hexameric protein [Lentihominibacter sp.]
MKYRDMINLLEEIAPVEPYRDIDNSGEQIYTGREEINRVLVCLEMNGEIIDEALEKRADMIITHHPLIFNPEYRLSSNEFPGRYVIESIKNDICVYSSHLAFDFAPEGNNDFIAKLLNLFIKEKGSMEEGYFGMLPEPMDFDGACRYVEQCLELPEHYIRAVDGGRKQLVTAGFCTGAGGNYIITAADRGCDLFITGDVKLHEAQYAKARGMSVIDAGHYGTEKIFTENMAHQIYAKASMKGLTVDVIMAEANTNPYIL